MNLDSKSYYVLIHYITYNQ